MKTFLDVPEEVSDDETRRREKEDRRLRMAKLGKLGKGEAKRRTPEHYRTLSELASEGRKKAALEKPGWNAARMQKAWATRRARGG